VLDVKLSTQKTLNRHEGELDVALLKAWMGMVESWELHQASSEVKAAFLDTIQALWAESKRTKQRPRLPPERVAHAERLLSSGLAVKVEEFIEVPCVTAGWEAVEERRARDRARQAKKRQVTRDSRVSHGGVTRDIPAPAESLGISNGTPPATRARVPEEELRSKTKSKSTDPARARRCPLSWQPNLAHVSLANEIRVNLGAEVEKFRDYEFGVPKSDWDATFRNWLRNAAEKSRPRARQPTADERKLEAIRRSDMLFDNWGEGHEPERSQANREQPEHALSSRLVGRTNDPVRH
jgi:hypothetical protein